jgi:hypothetical protein
VGRLPRGRPRPWACRLPWPRCCSRRPQTGFAGCGVRHCDCHNPSALLPQPGLHSLPACRRAPEAGVRRARCCSRRVRCTHGSGGDRTPFNCHVRRQTVGAGANTASAYGRCKSEDQGEPVEQHRLLVQAGMKYVDWVTAGRYGREQDGGRVLMHVVVSAEDFMRCYQRCALLLTAAMLGRRRYGPERSHPHRASAPSPAGLTRTRSCGCAHARRPRKYAHGKNCRCAGQSRF